MWDQIIQYFTPWSLGIIASAIVLVFCRRQPIIGRRLLGSLFLLGGLANVYLAWIYPRDYLVFGQFTFLPIYRRFIYMVLFRQAVWMGGILVLVHFYLAYSFLRKGLLTTPTIAMAALLLLLLAPLGFGSLFPATLLLLLGLYYLSAQDRN
jgi:hypothetical protein